MTGSLRDIGVLFVTGRTGLTLSRVERSWLPLMAALIAEGARVHVITAPRGPLIEPARAIGATIAPGRVDRFNIWITRNRLRASLRRLQPAVAFGTDYRADVPLRLAARGLPVKVVSAVHCGGWPVRGFGPLSTWGRRFMAERTYAGVDVFTVDCAALVGPMTASGIPADRIRVMPPGVDIAATSRDAAVVVDLPEGRPRVGYAGALERSRGLGTLAAAAPAIRERYPAASVLIAGEGTARLGLADAGSGGAVDLLGRVASVPAVLAALDVCVFPSSEPGVPTPLLEAAALGRPIVAADVPGIRELFDDGAEIVVVPRGDARALADAVCALLDDPARARALGQAARARVIDDYATAAAARTGIGLVRALAR